VSRFGRLWAWLGLLLVLDVALPWFVLTRVEQMRGAFLFWTLWAAVAVATAFAVFLRWREVTR
jgi:hypothetical protein